MSADNKQENIDPQLTKAINNLINWEKEKEQILFEQNDNLNEKKFYLIKKEWMNDFKSSIKYDELIKNIKNDAKDEKKIISEFITNNLKNFQLSLFNYENQTDEYEKNIISSLLFQKEFVLEIINKELFNSLSKGYTKGFQALGTSINKKLIFRMSIRNKNIMLILLPIEGNNFYEIFLIPDKINVNEDQILFEEIKTKNINEIFSFLNLDINNINKKENIENLRIKKNEITYFTLIKKKCLIMCFSY